MECTANSFSLLKYVEIDNLFDNDFNGIQKYYAASLLVKSFS